MLQLALGEVSFSKVKLSIGALWLKVCFPWENSVSVLCSEESFPSENS
jgi:hypothetical protein